MKLTMIMSMKIPWEIQLVGLEYKDREGQYSKGIQSTK